MEIRENHPIAMAFETKLSPHELRAFYDKAYSETGYTFDKTPTETGAKEFKVAYAHPDKISLTIECKRLITTTIVVVNENK